MYRLHTSLIQVEEYPKQVRAERRVSLEVHEPYVSQPPIEDSDLFQLLANLIRVQLGRGHLLPVDAESEFKFEPLVRPQKGDQSDE